MPDELNERARYDYEQARRKSFVNRALAALSGEPTSLLSYDEIRKKLHIGGPVYQGVQTVQLDQIAGSLNRYHQFDRFFLPTQDTDSQRWQNISRVMYQDIDLPPVVLYKVGQVYFVVDGHHRVSVAREQGVEFIEAEVRECATRVDITPDLKPEDLEILHTKVHFLERSHLDVLRPGSNIDLTIPDGFDRILEHIAVHGYFMGLDLKRDITDAEEVTDWYDKVYLPIVNVIRSCDILDDFPEKTEGDLYLWVLDRQRYLHDTGTRSLQPPEVAAKEYVNRTRKGE
ncbi:MAG: hypothetical protein A2Y54_07115 [Chloroflexi bacterium RBG_16_51_16]|nr:MAG: hypothetical protein A2Y54_07115 [Chloroflexi bacterium RBG_16_51_16]